MEQKLKIYTNFNLNIDDIKILNLLYLPIIGPEALTIYTFLHSILDKNKLESLDFDKENILEILNLKYSEFNKNLNKLGAINLVRTFENNDSLIILLLAPFTAKNFIKDTTLGSYVEEIIGNDNFNKIINIFQIPKIDLKDYKETTKMFNEVFKENIINAYQKTPENISGRRPNNPNLSSFDFELFTSKIDVNLLKDGLTEEFKKNIETTSFVYSFNLEQMVNLFYDSIENNYFSEALFKKKTKLLYTFINKKEDKKSEDKDFIDSLNNIEAKELLEILIGDDYPIILLEKVKEIYINIDMPKGLINLMIMLIYLKKETIPALSYFKRVAESWQNEGVFTLEDAIDKYVNKTRKSNKRKTSKDIELEDWQVEGMKDIMKGFRNNE